MTSSQNQKKKPKMSQTIRDILTPAEERDAVLYLRIKQINKDFLAKVAKEYRLDMTDVVEKILDKMRLEDDRKKP